MTEKSSLSKPLALGLLGCLVLQLASLNPTLAVPYQAIGTTEFLAESEQVLLPRTVYQVSLASQQTDESDVLVFTGDVMLARNVEFLTKQNTPSFPFEKITLTDLGRNPAIIGNFEAAVPLTHVVTPSLAMRFSVDQTHLPVLKEAGYTHLSLANNHSFDYGNEGYYNAVTLLEGHHIDTLGNGREVGEHTIAYLDSPIGKIALLGINASDRVPNFNDVHDVMERARARSQYQIAYIHWGTEYDLVHSRVQEVFAKALVAQGVDLIVGHHPHVVQDIGLIDGVVVAYSLGNFVFDQYFDADVMRGLVVTVNLDGAPSLSLLPVTSEDHRSQPSFMERDAATVFLKDVASRSDPSLQTNIMNGTIALDRMVASSPKDAIILR